MNQSPYRSATQTTRSDASREHSQTRDSNIQTKTNHTLLQKRTLKSDSRSKVEHTSLGVSHVPLDGQEVISWRSTVAFIYTHRKFNSVYLVHTHFVCVPDHLVFDFNCDFCVSIKLLINVLMPIKEPFFFPWFPLTR